MTSPLSLHSVSKSFAGKPAVSDVSFTVQPGEIIGFLGPNGAGKTTTLRMALGLIKPDSGTVNLFGETPGENAFGRVGFLPEERGLYKKQTAREAIAHMARLNGLKKKQAFTLADDLLDRYGLGEAKRKKNKDMSKGMAQKVQLLAAIAHEKVSSEKSHRVIARLFFRPMSWNMPNGFATVSSSWPLDAKSLTAQRKQLWLKHRVA